jgi:hypothetical protein
MQDRALKLLFVIGGCVVVVSAIGILAVPLIVHMLGGPVTAG